MIAKVQRAINWKPQHRNVNKKYKKRNPYVTKKNLFLVQTIFLRRHFVIKFWTVDLPIARYGEQHCSKGAGFTVEPWKTNEIADYQKKLS